MSTHKRRRSVHPRLAQIRQTLRRPAAGVVAAASALWALGYAMGALRRAPVVGGTALWASLVLLAGIGGAAAVRLLPLLRFRLRARRLRQAPFAWPKRPQPDSGMPRQTPVLVPSTDVALPKATEALLAVLTQVLTPCSVALFVADRLGKLHVRAHHPRAAAQGVALWQGELAQRVYGALDPAAPAGLAETDLCVAPVWGAAKGSRPPLLWGAVAVRRNQALLWSTADLALVTGVAEQLGLAWGLEQALRASRRHLERLERIATTDGLTELVNRRHFSKLFALQLARARRYKRRLSLIFLDIDHFKEVNDTFGHAMGDKVLKKVSEVLRKTARCTDTVARLGGEEFAVLMEETGAKGAERYAERIREALHEQVFAAQNVSFRKTCSLGVATFPEHGEQAELLMARADEALYQAKRTGRNKTVIYHADPKGRV